MSILFKLILSTCFLLSLASSLLFPSALPKNYPPPHLLSPDHPDYQYRDEVKHGRDRRVSPPRVRSNIYCPYLGFSQHSHVMLCQYWPATLCALSILQESYCRVSSVIESYHDRFLIHGMWTINLNKRIRGSMFPQCCNNDRMLDWEEDIESKQEVTSMIAQYWPELLVPEGSTDFKRHGIWSHEWQKYGSCYAKHLEEKEQVQSYLLHATKLRSKIDLYAALKDDNIVPSSNKTYTLSQIEEAIFKKYKVNPEVSCLQLFELFDHQVIYQVLLCATKNQVMKNAQDPSHQPTLVNCSTTPRDESNFNNLRRCDPSQPILIPEAHHTLQRYQEMPDGGVMNLFQSLEQQDDDDDDDDDIWSDLN
ncbi:ribonuclease T2 [Acrasis kona]|uniref:Ribonuclease T2 n=1 Tax=Acrasis kona TaxID=1008807 RepID=A0AAW2Z9K3_9EUKA